MCGIVGYAGNLPAVSVLMKGLTRLEYRGYDSAGVAVAGPQGIELRRTVGKLRFLEDSLTADPITGRTGIGHTRWATHGEPNETNSHPHRDATETVFVAHNGIIENYVELRHELEAQGVVFRSATDTEVLPNLIKLHWDLCHDLVAATRAALRQVRGSYAIAVLHKDYPDTIVAARQMSPLVIGLGQGENFCASDVSAVLGFTHQVLYLDDGDLAVLRPDRVELTDLDGHPRPKTPVTIEWTAEQAEKAGYPHYMLKEIHEQPAVIETLLSRYTTEARTGVHLDQIGLSAHELLGIRRIFIQACGTSWHAGLIGKLLLERLPMVAVDVDVSSEFRYRNAVLSPNTLVIAISQSGETADTLAGIREAKRRGLKVVSIVNVPGSSIARESDGVIYTNAGPEIGVASTKAYTAQIAALYLLSLHLGQLHCLIDGARMQRRLTKLSLIPALMTRLLDGTSGIEQAAKQIAGSEHAMFIGRGFGYPSALEGALKLKEVSYIHAEGYAAGELKHGPIALIDERMPVVAIATSGLTYEKMVSNIQEVKARKGQVIAIVAENNQEVHQYTDSVIPVPELTESFTPFVVALPLQLLAYHVAVLRGCDVDQPRNLAKSVTVE